MSRLIAYVIFSLILVGFGIGCVGITKTFPEKKYFLIEASETKKISSIPKPYTFLIRKVSISQKFEGKEFVYRRDNVNYESDFYHAFFIPPATNIREEISKAFLSTNLFEWDASLHSNSQITHNVEIYISQLYGDFRTKSPVAILDFDIVVYSDIENRSSPIYRNTFTQSISIKEQSPEALAHGWNEGLQKSISMLTAELSIKLK